MVAGQAEQARRFLELHTRDAPLLLPNPWDVGSARLLATLGFEALATTSSGFAATLGRVDGSVTRAEALAHAAAVVGATALPVSADLENGFADAPGEVAQTVRAAIDAGLAGCSIEDFTGVESGPIYCLEHAVARIAGASEAAHGGPAGRLVLTARAENHIHGVDDLDGTIAFAAIGAVAEAARELLEDGTYGFLERARAGSALGRRAFS